MAARALELLAFSSLWVTAAAAALCAAVGRALGVPADAGTLALAAAGTFVVYNVDRLRDVSRDRDTSPRRTGFVESARPGLIAGVAVAAVLAAALAWRAGPAVWALLAPVAGLGFFHRRLKRFAWWKPVYLSGAWTAVAVGLPVAAASPGEPEHLAWGVAVLGPTFLANVIASNLRDDEAPSARFGPGVPLRLARGAAAGALLLALAAPAPVVPLALIPLATGAALLAFHPGELYGLVAVDGALVLGAVATLALQAGGGGPG